MSADSKDAVTPLDITSQNNLISDTQNVLNALATLRADMLQYVVPPQGQSNWINAVDVSTERMSYVLRAMQSAQPTDFLPGAVLFTFTKEEPKHAHGHQSGQGVSGTQAGRR